jgi:hypothetical protein
MFRQCNLEFHYILSVIFWCNWRAFSQNVKFHNCAAEVKFSFVNLLKGLGWHCTVKKFLMNLHCQKIPHTIMWCFFLCPLGILYSNFQCRRCIRNPAPGRMRYLFIVIAVCSERWLPVGSGLQDPQQLWGRPAL